MPSLPPPKTSHFVQAETDADVGSNPTRSPYLRTLRGIPAILEAMDYV